MFIADFHVHSAYSRATSKECVPEFLDLWARRKGLALIGTGDFTHAAWRAELREKLIPTDDGLYVLKKEHRMDSETAGAQEPVRFMVTGEISSIYKKDGKVRKVHNLILLPDLDKADALSRRLETIGNLRSDGRPILGLDSKALLQITLETCPNAVFIPAHIWTPHFSLFGTYSGFDDIEECFEELTPHIHALETGLSSDPPMNWRLSALDRFTLVSNSDAHSPGNLAREANLFETELSYAHIANALANKQSGAFRGTLEFFPEEGKYHFDGHRNCGVCQPPTQTLAAKGVCPVCGGRITVGVLHRVEALADRADGFVPPEAPRYESLIPLPEVIAASTGLSAASAKGKALYARLLRELGPELDILRKAPVEEIARAAGPAMAEGIRRLREGKVDVSPGYDGEYGKVRILDPDEIAEASGQIRLFLGEPARKAAPAPKKAPAKEAAAPLPPAAQENEVPSMRAEEGDGLNPEQRAAAFSGAPVTAVIAGPGTGKTKTLVARISYLVRQLGASPAAITAVSFTNKAAGEMRNRLSRQWDNVQAVKAMRIGTFHAICLDLLRQRGGEIAVLDDAAAGSVVKEVLGELGLKLPAREALREISLFKCGASASPALPEGVYAAYQARLAEYGAMDYDDILLRALETEVPATRFDHLLVDEFQDMNPVQYRLMQKWAKHSQSVFVIGDPDQSIYGFRGSTSQCFSWLRADFPGLAEVALTRNYRSTAEILAASAPIVAGREAPGLDAQRGRGAKVRFVDAGSTFSEALFVAKEIGRMVGGIDMLKSGAASPPEKVWGFSDIAVLYRLNRQAALLEECLAKEGIPHVVSGRDAFLTHPETAKLLAFFRLLLNPGDAVSLRTCLAELSGCGEAQVQAVLQRYRKAEKTLASLCKALQEGAADAGALPLLADRVGRYGQAARREKPQRLVARWLSEQGVADADWADKVSRMAVFHDRMADLLRAVTLGQESDIRRYGGKKHTSDAVSLMTLHGAKGLEFPVVFLCGVTEGLIPHKGHGDSPTDEGEERRLLYVGMTRAKDELILVNAGSPSPFLSDLPPDLLDRQALPRRKSAVVKQVSFLS